MKHVLFVTFVAASLLLMAWSVRTFEERTVTICHKPQGETSKTLKVDQSAVAAHVAHGDSLGACPVSPVQ